MCGIWCFIVGKGAKPTAEMCSTCVKQLEARGPEFTAIQSDDAVILGFTRLAINGLTPLGHQPFVDGDTSLICNGEIYNHKELAERHAIPTPEGTSDCFVILQLLKRLSPQQVCRTLDGVFAFVHYDKATKEVLVARDPYGVRPLFEAITEDGARVFASELKGFQGLALQSVAPFPPGTYKRYSAESGKCLDSQRYHTVPHVKLAAYSNTARNGRADAKVALRTAVIAAVHKRLDCERPVGALLSGGLDSSLIASIAARHLKTKGQHLHTFSIGMPGSTDLVFAKRVAEHIGSVHHEIVKTREEFLAAIPEVIRVAETYDITSVRATVGNYLVGKYIRDTTDIKVVLNGDGSDEVGGGYLYFYKAPTDEEFEAETERLLEEIHLYDVLRSDRGMAANGLEARTPFLDKTVVATWKAMDTKFRRPSKGSPDGRGIAIEKYILRQAFEEGDWLPHQVLYRKKEAFSDGVSSAETKWYELPDDAGVDVGTVAHLHNPPRTQEAYRYRMRFNELYGDKAATLIPRMWMPIWVEGATDPSARTLTGIYSTLVEA